MTNLELKLKLSFSKTMPSMLGSRPRLAGLSNGGVGDHQGLVPPHQSLPPIPNFFIPPHGQFCPPPDKFFSTCLARNILVFVQQIRSGLVGFLSNIRHSNSYSRCLLFFKLHINFVVNRVVNRVHPLEVPPIWNLEWTASPPPPRL